MEKYEYDKSGRLKYTLDFHFNHKKDLSEIEKAYLCRFWHTDGSKLMEMALGRTQSSLAGKVDRFRHSGQFDYYYNLWDELIAEEWRKHGAI